MTSERYSRIDEERRARCTRDLTRAMLAGIAIVISVVLTVPVARADDIFIGDAGDNTVKRVDATTGAYRGTFAVQQGLNGPVGMIFTDGELLVVNQNKSEGINQPNGEVFRFDERTGLFLGKLFSSTDRGAAFAPQGIVLGDEDDKFYVADLGVRDDDCVNQGDIKVYSHRGAFLGNLDRRGFKPAFYPRGVVFGPDGLLYVSARGCPLNAGDSQIAYVLRFNPHSRKFVDVFASDATVAGFHRPEGLVFDDRGNLWITSFRDNTKDGDVDRILKLDGRTGRLLDSLPLWTAGHPRAFAQTILFGPDGKLFVPIFGDADETTGQLRRCDTKTKHCVNLVEAGGPLQMPLFVIFRRSDPSTLRYRGR
ncbi:hypothetical protein [Paraburkholderia sp. C35]|uniref:hypothetical protein n=1 Tax=Paraburkholderia sp. C35 TaxID=2126993 RepID=UPI000D69A942|nr:hypothetical protein [Paraburkholderia sp. C35]